MGWAVCMRCGAEFGCGDERMVGMKMKIVGCCARPCSAFFSHFSMDSTHAQSNEQAFGTYASSGGTKLTYRVKKEGTYGGYKIVTEVLACASQVLLLSNIQRVVYVCVA